MVHQAVIVAVNTRALDRERHVAFRHQTNDVANDAASDQDLITPQYRRVESAAVQDGDV